MQSKGKISGESNDSDHIVLLIHGIRTQAAWAEMVAAVLETGVGIKVQPIKYGYFDTFRFWSPFLTRKKVIDRIVREYRDIKLDNPACKISVVAHSFGTFALTQALTEPDVELHKIILCGSIAPNSFRVANHRSQIDYLPILNDCGTHDIWPVIAKASTWGYGPTGTYGFGTNGIRDRFHKFTHSEYFDREFVENYWKPFISDDEIVPSEWEVQRDTPPYWQSFLATLPIRWFLIVLPVLLAWLAYTYYDNQKTAGVEIKSPLLAGHVVGATEVGVNLEFTNGKSEDISFKNFTAKLTSPDGDTILLNYFGVSVGNMLQLPLPQIYLKAGRTEQYTFAFRGNFSEQSILFAKLNNYHMQNPISLPAWVPGREIMPVDIKTQFIDLANTEFKWAPGEWKYQLSYTIDDEPFSVRSDFQLDENQIRKMKVNIEHYGSGLGIAPNWIYLGPDNLSVLQSITINNKAIDTQ